MTPRGLHPRGVDWLFHIILSSISPESESQPTTHFCCQKRWHNHASIREGGGPRSGGRSLRERGVIDKVRISRTNFVDKFEFPPPISSGLVGRCTFARILCKNHNLSPFYSPKPWPRKASIREAESKKKARVPFSQVFDGRYPIFPSRMAMGKSRYQRGTGDRLRWKEPARVKKHR